MATFTTAGFHFGGIADSRGATLAQKERRRYITPQAGRALEILGHAIEYLTDELVQEGRRVNGHDPQVQAIQLLMGLNRQVYYECPIMPTFSERLHAYFRARSQKRVS